MKKHLLILISSFFFLPAISQKELKGITWVLLKIDDKKNETTVTINHDHSVLRFEDSTYAGYGCDAYSGRYKITGNKINFLGGMQFTDAGCTNPNDFTAEDYVMKNFIQLEYKLVVDSLILSNLTKGNEVVFTFVKRKNAKKKKK